MVMIVTKMSLPRRTVLRGGGALIALPLLEAMVPAFTATAKTAANPKPRLGFFYVPHGMPVAFLTPKQDGLLAELPPILKPAESLRPHLTVVTGLSNAAAEDPTVSTGPHTRCGVCWLSGVLARRTEGADIRLGTTLDQFAAQQLGKDTALVSLELALDNNTAVGNCDVGYSCAYLNTFSWRTATTPNPMEINPRRVFNRLFGDGGSGAQQLRELRRDRSILDWFAEDLTRLERSLGPRDRGTVDEYLEGVRDVETRIQKAEAQSSSSPLVTTNPPFGIPDSYDEHAKLMMDLLFLAYQADITRVATFQLNRELSGQAFPWIGVPIAHHDASHHGGNPDRVADFVKINTYHVSLMARFVDKLQHAPDGDGTLLDHSMLMLGSGMGDGNLHSPHNLPTIIFGHLGGLLPGNQHIRYAVDTPFMNLGLSLLDKVGVHVDKIGDSTGRLTGV
jgi:hypothetical protein